MDCAYSWLTPISLCMQTRWAPEWLNTFPHFPLFHSRLPSSTDTYSATLSDKRLLIERTGQRCNKLYISGEYRRSQLTMAMQKILTYFLLAVLCLASVHGSSIINRRTPFYDNELPEKVGDFYVYIFVR
jgi:hypothetical protein